MRRETREYRRYSSREPNAPRSEYGRYGELYDRPESDEPPRAGRIPAKILLFLVALGGLVYGVRGVGTGSAQWDAALITLAVLALMVVGQGIGYALRKRRGDSPDRNDSP
jgi:hypothetical protein